VEGRWIECGEGFAYVSPPGATSAFEALPDRRWQFAWVFTGNPANNAAGPEFCFARSALVPADPGPLAAAIEGIYREGIGQTDRLLLDDWARLVRAYTARIVQFPLPSHRIDPLARLWEEVDARPAADWSLARLSGLAHMSAESLRKLCLLHHGRSPMEQVTHLRMRRADTLLRSTSMKLVVIAQMVGYENVFAFSTAFRRWCGVPPSTRRR
jgi:AraC-like DNA-binding protein